MGVQVVEEMEDFKLNSMRCELNYLSKSDGSAILAQGETVTLVSVNGPMDIKTQHQNVQKAHVEILFLSKGGRPCVSDRLRIPINASPVLEKHGICFSLVLHRAKLGSKMYNENMIRQTCKAAVLCSLYPRAGITVTVQELEDFGGLLSCAVNNTCLALLNSGVAMRSVFAAVSCCVLQDGNLALQPSAEQLRNARSVLHFVFDGRDRSLISGFTEGTFSNDTYHEALERCRLASDLVFQFYRDIVRKYSEVV